MFAIMSRFSTPGTRWKRKYSRFRCRNLCRWIEQVVLLFVIIVDYSKNHAWEFLNEKWVIGSNKILISVQKPQSSLSNNRYLHPFTVLLVCPWLVWAGNRFLIFSSAENCHTHTKIRIRCVLIHLIWSDKMFIVFFFVCVLSVMFMVYQMKHEFHQYPQESEKIR